MSAYSAVYRNFRFKVSLENIDNNLLAEAHFSEVSGIDATYDVIEYRDGDDALATPEKYSGLIKYSNITLSRGMTESLDFYQWIMTASGDALASGVALGTFKGSNLQKTGSNGSTCTMTIQLLDDQGASPVASWKFRHVWPVKYTGPDFKGTGSEIALEKLEVAHRGFTLTQGA